VRIEVASACCRVEAVLVRDAMNGPAREYPIDRPLGVEGPPE
jgi:hypothetical protein